MHVLTVFCMHYIELVMNGQVNVFYLLLNVKKFSKKSVSKVKLSKNIFIKVSVRYDNHDICKMVNILAPSHHCTTHKAQQQE